MEQNKRFFRIAAIAALVSCVMLLLLALIVFPEEISYPGLDVLTGNHSLSTEDSHQFNQSLQNLYGIDTVFLFGWFISWIGISLIVKEKNPLLGIVSMVFGLLGALCDVGENSVIWSVVQANQGNINLGTQWVILWKSLQQFSYWLPFIGAAIISITLLQKKAIYILLFVIGTLGSLVAGVGVYIPALNMFSNVWFLLWFACIAVVLWQYAKPDQLNSKKRKITTMAVSVASQNEKTNRIVRMVLFTLIYFVEGFMLTYSSGFNTLYLRSFELSFSQIGLAGGVVLIPFVLKIFIGLLSDRVNLFNHGHRKPYILIGLTLQILAFIVIPFVNPGTQFGVYLMMMIFAALGMSTYDTASDGYSIDTTPEQDRGLVQGLMVGGRALSSVIAALVMGQLSNNGNWTGIFTMIAVVSVAVLLYTVFFIKEDVVSKEKQEFSKGAFSAFKDWGFILFLILGMLYPLALYSSQGMVSAYLNEGLGFSLITVGQYTAVFGIGTIFGGVVGGPMMKKLGEKASLLAALILTSVVTFVLAFTASAGLLWAIVFVFGFCFGYYETVYMAMGMDFADPRIGAFMFSIIMAVGNFGIAAGSPLAGTLVDNLGFQPMFMVFAGIHLLALPLIFGVFKLKKNPETVEA